MLDFQFFVFGSLFDYCDAMCADLKKLHNCQFINKDTLIKNKLLWFLYKVHNSGILNRWFRLPFRSVWYGCLFDKKRLNTQGGRNHFVFFDSNPHVYDPCFLTWLSKLPNATLSLVFVNSMRARNMRDIGYFRKHFNRIYTTDRTDAQDYGFQHVEGIHSKQEFDKEIELKYDVMFVGADKGRGRMLSEIYQMLVSHQKQCRFTVVGLENGPEGIHTERIPYSAVMEEVLASRAILEICHQQQNANTQRALEAIMYDKVLITNNRNVLHSPYYDPKTMIIFNQLDQLKDMRIYDQKTVDYGYKNDFSPIHILEDIESTFCTVQKR